MTRPATQPPATSHLDSMLASWIPGQRWFAGKGRPLRRTRVVHRIPFPGSTAAAAWHAELLIVRADYRQSATPEYYLVPIGTRQDTTPELEHAVIGHTDGQPVYDALHDPHIVLKITETLLQKNTGHPQITIRTTDTTPAPRPDPATVKVMLGEQSNTSVALGDTAILKIFRQLRPGENPEPELLRLLTEAGQPHVPPLLAAFEGPTEGGTATYGIIQRFLPGASDGWAMALASVRELLADPKRASEAGGDFSAESHRLGQAVADIHNTLAQTAPTVSLTRNDLRELSERMRTQLETARQISPAIRPIAGTLSLAFHDLAASPPGITGQRLHGDLHLGQALRTATHWSIIDFEGEPASTFARRRAPQPVAKDIAGILRSFDYAAHHELLRAEAPLREGCGTHEVVGAWAERNQTSFCEGYAAHSRTHPVIDPTVLRAYLIDKAVYELIYETRNRPSWAPIPLRALKKLARHRPKQTPGH